MSRTSIRFVSGLLGLALLSCGGRTALWVLEPNAHEAAGSEPGDGRRPPSDGGPCPAGAPCNVEKGGSCAALERDPMGCAACARARVPGLSCVAGACQQKKCAGPVTFRKIASYTPSVVKKDNLFGVGYLGADMNRDGRLDLLELSGENGENPAVAIWLGQGDGTFVVSTNYPTVGNFATPNLPGYAAVGDFNEDGLADLLVSDHEDLTDVWIRPGLRGGGLGGRPGVPFSRQLMADLDGDCHLDLVTTPNEGEETTVLVLRGRGDGKFASPRKNLVRDGGLPWGLADWNGDGILDILVEGTVLHVLPGKGDGNFAEEQRCAVGTGLRPAVYTDLNQDGRLDMLWTLNTKGLVTMFGQGGCSFTPRTDYVFPFEAAVFALGDLNGDGLPDVAVMGWEKNSNRSSAIGLLIGSADGKFTRQPDLDVACELGDLLIADVNGDGRADLVSVSSNGIEVFANTCE
jgi:hypothetical protein